MLTSALIATLAMLYTKHRGRIRARVSRFFGRDVTPENVDGV